MSGLPYPVPFPFLYKGVPLPNPLPPSRLASSDSVPSAKFYFKAHPQQE